MTWRIMFLAIALEWYVYKKIDSAIKVAISCRCLIKTFYWAAALISGGITLVYHWPFSHHQGQLIKGLYYGVWIIYGAKIFVAVSMFIHDVRWLGMKLVMKGKDTDIEMTLKPAYACWAQRTILAAFVFAAVLTYGVLTGVYRYQVRRVTFYLPHLPSVFNGFTIAHISDIHIGSLISKKEVQRGIAQLMREEPDLIFFTGDLVNRCACEVTLQDINLFKQIKAPLGVYAILGNHDYGTYVKWPSKAAQKHNFKRMLELYHFLGWQLLRNQHCLVEKGGQFIAVVGIENWSPRGPRYGDLEKALVSPFLNNGTGKSDLTKKDGLVKLLLSHDPAHWGAEVLTDFPAIDITFSGHTHGGQYGVQWGPLRWSLARYFSGAYHAGLYQAGHQYLYVNRGFGHSRSLLGRLGVWPEITLVTLRRGSYGTTNSPRML